MVPLRRHGGGAVANHCFRHFLRCLMWGADGLWVGLVVGVAVAVVVVWRDGVEECASHWSVATEEGWRERQNYCGRDVDEAGADGCQSECRSRCGSPPDTP